MDRIAAWRDQDEDHQMATERVTSKMHEPVKIHRRDALCKFLKGSMAAGAACFGVLPASAIAALATASGAEDAEPESAKAPEAAADPYAGFKMGLQSYSLRKKSAEDALNLIFDLDLKWVEFYPGHYPLEITDYDERLLQKVMRWNSIRAGAYGVVKFTQDHEQNRRIFELAKKLSLLSISADPEPESFSSLERLVEEFKIPVAIHNHGPGHRYDRIETIDKAIQGRHKLIGLCVDTGHFLRAGVNPVEVAKHFKERVYGVHLKDVKSLAEGKKQFTVLGEGDLETLELLKVLRRQKFQGCLALEYEEEPDDPMPSIRRCLETVRRLAAQIASS
jgi:sugar phosphate isomerase/epimerase